LVSCFFFLLRPGRWIYASFPFSRSPPSSTFSNPPAVRGIREPLRGTSWSVNFPSRGVTPSSLFPEFPFCYSRFFSAFLPQHKWFSKQTENSCSSYFFVLLFSSFFPFHVFTLVLTSPFTHFPSVPTLVQGSEYILVRVDPLRKRTIPFFFIFPVYDHVPFLSVIRVSPRWIGTLYIKH